jgi:hypothetical protein
MRWQVLPDDQIEAKRKGVPPRDCRKASFTVELFFRCQNGVENWISFSDENHAKDVTNLNSQVADYSDSVCGNEKTDVV